MLEWRVFWRRAAGAALSLATAAALASCAGGPDEELPDPHDPAVRIRALLEDKEAPVLAFHTGDTVHFGEGVRELYRLRDYEPAWLDRNGFLPRGEALLRQIGQADAEGLHSEAYHRETVRKLVERARGEHVEELPVGDLLGNLDMLMTESFLRYTSDLVRGTVSPVEAEPSWTIPLEDATDAAFVQRLLEHEDFERALTELRPAVPYYDHLKAALPRYRDVVDKGGWAEVDAGPPLKEGTVHPRVRQVRARLLAEGDPVETPLVQGAPEPDRYDANLALAVEHFQQRHGVEVDGAVGPGTVEAMNVPADERLVGLLLNLDRWRWLPRELGERYVLVNVAGFQLVVMEEHEPALSMNVVVGQEGWKTPIFRDTMEYIVVNPYWNVPPSIAREELLPIAARDPGYFARNNYEVTYRGGEQVIRQRPGRGNALGKVKFLFPNANNVYLHDTPADHLFSRVSRAFSHGCIRVEKPEELARYLLRTSTSRSEDDFEKMVSTGREQWVSLDDKLPVYILYFTAWAGSDGSVSFYPDVYKRDESVKRFAGEKLEASRLRYTDAEPELDRTAERPDA